MSSKITDNKPLTSWEQNRKKMVVAGTLGVIAAVACIFLAVSAHNLHNQISDNWDQIHAIVAHDGDTWFSLFQRIQQLDLIMVCQAAGSALFGIASIALLSYALYKRNQSKKPQQDPLKPHEYKEADIWKNKLKGSMAIILAAAAIAGCIAYSVFALNTHKGVGDIWDQIHQAWNNHQRNSMDLYANIMDRTDLGWTQLGAAIGCGALGVILLGLGIHKIIEAKRAKTHLNVMNYYVKDLSYQLT